MDDGVNRRVELRHLRYFLAVADTLNFTEAARVQNTSQPSLSQQIRALEREIGCPLFERTTRTVRLTPAGSLLAAHVREAFGAIATGFSAAREAGREVDGQIRVGFVVAAEIRLFPRILPRLRDAMPWATLSLTSLSTAQQLQDLRDLNLDVGFLRPPVHDPALATLDVMTEEIGVVVPVDHPLARCERVNPAMLADETVIGLSDMVPGLRHAIAQWQRDESVTLRLAGQADNVMEYMSMIRLGLGLGLLPEFTQDILLQGLVSRPLDGVPPRIKMVMAYRRDHASPAVREFVERVRTEVQASDALPASAGASGGHQG